MQHSLRSSLIIFSLFYVFVSWSISTEINNGYRYINLIWNFYNVPIVEKNDNRKIIILTTGPRLDAKVTRGRDLSIHP